MYRSLQYRQTHFAGRQSHKYLYNNVKVTERTWITRDILPSLVAKAPDLTEKSKNAKLPWLYTDVSFRLVRGQIKPLLQILELLSIHC